MLCNEKSLENGKRLKCTRCGKCAHKPLIIRNECGDLQMNEDMVFVNHKIIYEKLHAYEQTGLNPDEINLYVKCQAHSVSKREAQLGLEVDRLQRELDDVKAILNKE